MTRAMPSTEREAPGSVGLSGPAAARPPQVRTGRGDTVLAFTAAALAVALVIFGACAVVIGRVQIGQARQQLERALFTVAAAEHLSPRDPSVLPAVAKHLRNGVLLTPTTDFRHTGAVIIRWRRLNGRSTTVCVILPAQAGGRVTDCPSQLIPAHSGA